MKKTNPLQHEAILKKRRVLFNEVLKQAYASEPSTSHDASIHDKLSVITYDRIKDMIILESEGDLQLLDDRKATNTYMIFYRRYNRLFFTEDVNVAQREFQRLVKAHR